MYYLPSATASLDTFLHTWNDDPSKQKAIYELPDINELIYVMYAM